jgi:hypothetical protein
MALTDRLLISLNQSAAALCEQTQLVEAAGLRSVTLIGSLSRADFIEGGSDVDLLFVHSLGEQPAAELCAHPTLRAVVHHLGAPLLAIGRNTGRQKPFLIDCHFADVRTVADQPRWADPSGFLREYQRRERYLWIYAFDLLEHGWTLWGEPPAAAVTPYDPAAYVPLLVPCLREELARLQSFRVGAAVSPALISDWKRLVGQVLTLLALQYGSRSLRKQDTFRFFNLRVPYFPGKDFAGHIWSEYLYGIVYDERDEWVRRCSRLCENGLKVLDSC